MISVHKPGFFLLFIIILLFLFLIPKNYVYEYPRCEGYTSGCINDSDCNYCSGGDCKDTSLRTLTHCETCKCGDINCESPCWQNYEYNKKQCSCLCWEETCIMPGRCYYPSSCWRTDCIEWGPWGDCVGDNYKYRFCRTAGNDAYELQWSSSGIVRVGLI